MENKHISYPNQLLIPEAIKMLREKSEVCLTAMGRSMHPYIRHRKDVLVLKAVDTDALAVGDVVLAYTTLYKYVVHRIVRISGDTITLKGDGNLFGTEQAPRQQVYAYLTAIERDGRRIHCNTSAQRFKAWAMRTAYRVPRQGYWALKAVIRKIFKIV